MGNIAKWAPGSLLVVVALTQIYLAAGGELTPWKGGGFGMFSVVNSRSLSVDCVDASGTPCRVFIPRRGRGALPSRFERAFRAYPTAARKAELADFVAGRELRETTLETVATRAGVRDALQRWPAAERQARYLE